MFTIKIYPQPAKTEKALFFCDRIVLGLKNEDRARSPFLVSTSTVKSGIKCKKSVILGIRTS